MGAPVYRLAGSSCTLGGASVPISSAKGTAFLPSLSSKASCGGFKEKNGKRRRKKVNFASVSAICRIFLQSEMHYRGAPRVVGGGVVVVR